MAMTIEAAIAAIQAHALSLQGIRKAPTFPPDKAPPGPFAVCAPKSGDWTPYSDFKKGMQTVVCSILTPYKDMARDVERLLPYGETFPNAILADLTLSGTVDTIKTLRWAFSTQEYNGITHIGWRFEIEFKQETAIT